MRLPVALARPIVFAGVTAVAGAVTLAGSLPVRLVGVSARSDGTGQTILIEASDPVAYTIKRPNPLTVFVDLPNVSVSEAARQGSRVPDGPVRAYSVESVTDADGSAVARVRLELAAPVPHRVRSSRNTIRVEFSRAKVGASSVAPSPPATSDAPTRRLQLVTTEVQPGRVLVTLKGNGRLETSRVAEAQDLPPRVVLDFVGVDSNAPARTAGPAEPVESIRVARNSDSPLVTRVVVDLNRMVPYRLERSGTNDEDLTIVFDSAKPPVGQQAADRKPAEAPVPVTAAAPPAASAPPRPPAPARPAPAPKSDGAPTREASVAAVAPAGAVDPFSALAPGPAKEIPSAVAARPPLAATTASSEKTQVPQVQKPQPKPLAPEVPAQQYTGNPVTLDFQDADLRAVLRTFAEISGLNMVIDPAVEGSVDVVLNQVPWDQALDIILRGGKLGYAVDGTVVRIAPLSVLAEEEAARRKLADAQALAGTLTVMTKSLSYAKANALKDLITRAALSQRGEVQVDERTNTLIMRDLRPNLETAERLIADLDRPEPQVEIEARIVQTARGFARALGVQWGLNGRMAPEMGNTTSWGFPNRGVLEGRVGDQGLNDPRASSLDKFGTAIKLLPAEANSGIGLLLQSINGAFNLDVTLAALERSGKGRFLSTPRVTTQNNQEAEITQGVQIPIQTVANNTVTVTFKDAALTLKVTPQITSADTVIMRITLENALPDYGRSINGIPPINTQRAVTQVQVSDGATTVIGGILMSNETTKNGKVPLLHKIPLLGWLFRSDEVKDDSSELLIFITPRILRG